MHPFKKSKCVIILKSRQAIQVFYFIFLNCSINSSKKSESSTKIPSPREEKKTSSERIDSRGQSPTVTVGKAAKESTSQKGFFTFFSNKISSTGEKEKKLPSLSRNRRILDLSQNVIATPTTGKQADPDQLDKRHFRESQITTGRNLFRSDKSGPTSDREQMRVSSITSTP